MAPSVAQSTLVWQYVIPGLAYLTVIWGYIAATNGINRAPAEGQRPCTVYGKPCAWTHLAGERWAVDPVRVWISQARDWRVEAVLEDLKQPRCKRGAVQGGWRTVTGVREGLGDGNTGHCTGRGTSGDA